MQRRWIAVLTVIVGLILIVSLQAQSNNADSAQSAQPPAGQGYYGPPCGGPGCGGYGPRMGGWGPGPRMGWGGGPGGGGPWGGGPGMMRGWGGPGRGYGPGAAWADSAKAQAADIGKQLNLNDQQTNKLQGILQQPWTVGPRAGVYTPKQRAEAIGKQLNLKSEQTTKLQALLEKQGPGPGYGGCPGWRWSQTGPAAQ